jgi:hypothetical protein
MTSAPSPNLVRLAAEAKRLEVTVTVGSQALLQRSRVQQKAAFSSALAQAAGVPTKSVTTVQITSCGGLLLPSLRCGKPQDTKNKYWTSFALVVVVPREKYCAVASANSECEAVSSLTSILATPTFKSQLSFFLTQAGIYIAPSDMALGKLMAERKYAAGVAMARAKFEQDNLAFGAVGVNSALLCIICLFRRAKARRAAMEQGAAVEVEEMLQLQPSTGEDKEADFQF